MSLIENKIIVLDSLFVEESEVQHNQVFPLDLGGEVKTKYYFSEELTSEAIVSLDFFAPEKNRNFEFVVFTEEQPSEDTSLTNPFMKVRNEVVKAMTEIYQYAEKGNTLAPFQTISTKSFDDKSTNYFLILPCPYIPTFKIDNVEGQFFTLMQIFESEFNTLETLDNIYDLLDLLQDAGYEPFSDMNREAVI